MPFVLLHPTVFTICAGPIEMCLPRYGSSTMYRVNLHDLQGAQQKDHRMNERSWGIFGLPFAFLISRRSIFNIGPPTHLIKSRDGIEDAAQGTNRIQPSPEQVDIIQQNSVSILSRPEQGNRCSSSVLPSPTVHGPSTALGTTLTQPVLYNASALKNPPSVSTDIDHIQATRGQCVGDRLAMKKARKPTNGPGNI